MTPEGVARHRTLIAKGGITGILGRLEARGLVKRMENTMKVAQFSYHDPASLPEALGLLTQLENTRLLAGGQSLLPYLAFRMLRCDHLIDLNAITELAGIQEKDGRLVIGAMTRQREIAGSARVGLHCPIALDALRLIGHIATRTRGTLGGSLSNMDPSAELFGVSALHDATFHVESTRGRRDIAVWDWADTFMKPAIAKDEMLTSVSWRPWPTGHGHAFLEFSKRHHDYAIVAAGALITVDDERRIQPRLGHGARVRYCAIPSH